MVLRETIEEYLFGDRPTSELSSQAFDVKTSNFGEKITYSPKVFIPLTTLCQDSCAYCTFVKSPKEGVTYLNYEEVDAIASVGVSAGCYEALFTLGDKPELKWDFALKQLNTFGFSSTHEYLIENMKKIHNKHNIFPHANPGLMSRDEIINYKRFSPSGGLMLESYSPKLLEKGKAHYKAKTKQIELRLETLENAQEVKYPMTTGLLIGITETKDDLIEDIFRLIETCNKNSAVQEIILQNFRAKQNTLMRNDAEVINDLGGISPKTIDWVNPDHLWPDIENLENLTLKSGQSLIKRLPVYPKFINNEWLSPRVLEKVSNVIDKDGYPEI